MAAACTLTLGSLRATLSFLAGSPAARSPPGVRGPEGTLQAPRAAASAQRQPPSRALGLEFVGACIVGCFVAARATMPRGGAATSSRKQRTISKLARRAEDDEEIGSLLGGLEEMDAQDTAEAEAAEKELENLAFDEGSLDGTQSVSEMSAEEAARRGEQQLSYNLYPSRQYVLYIAKKNAERLWAKDGPGGAGSNKGCIEVQVALLTERIRAMVMHIRDFKHDFVCRVRLVSLVSRRRRLLDKLAWKDLESYLKIRDELKIRHVYRMEALIGRLPEYRYTIRDRKQAPGRKVANRLKKTKRLLQRRLAAQLRQGKPRAVIHKTEKKIKSRKWLARAYDEVENLIDGKTPTEYVDPLNLP